MGRFLPCIVLIFAVLTGTPGSGSDFGPWSADVPVGDKAVTQPIPGSEPVKEISAKTLYNGLGGGAYFLIRFFQLFISPQDGPGCRYHPVCSVYGRTAVERYGALLGPMLAGDRILRCNPFSKPGDDPVPQSLSDDR